MNEDVAVLRVALLQTAPRLGEVSANLKDLHERLNQVSGADIAVTPELALHGYHLGSLTDVEPVGADDPRIADLSRYGPAVIVGFAEAQRHHRYNSAAIVDGGQVRMVQRKLYLPNYRDWEERKHFRPGDRLRCIDIRGVRLAVLICNDLWQPPLLWLAAHDDAEVLIVIANSVHSQPAADVRRVWDLLIAHAAVTAQCHVVFVNRSGTENDRRFWGGSCVVGPDGQTLVRLGEDPDTVEVKLDLAMVRDLRRRWPLLQEPRFELIARETARLAAQQ